MLIDYSVLDRHWSASLIPRLQRRDGTPLQLFVAGDVDGLCALRLLEHVLAFDHVAWEATPVLSYDDLTTSLLSSFAFTRSSHSASHPASYLLVQCGANVDLTQLLRLDEPLHDHVLLYVLDSHRPLHFNNVHSDTTRIQCIAPADDLRTLPPLEDEPDDDEDDDEDDDSAPAVARRRLREAVQVRNRAAFREYYAQSFYSTPVSVMTYDLCVRLNRESALALWWAIVGLTDAFVHERVGGGPYDGWVNQLNDSLARTNVTNEDVTAYDHPLFPSSNPPAPPERSASSASVGGSPALASPTSSASSIPMPSRTAIGHITFTRHELRLLHLRHLPLYDSMQHSPYLSSHLRRWNDRGVGHIRTLLVELGIPLEKARQQWMEEEMLWRLREGMEALIDKHPRLKDMRMASFYRQCTPTLTLSAVDTVHIAAALLEQERIPAAAASASAHSTSAGPPSKRIRPDPDAASSLRTSDSSSSTCPEFWEAYRAVGCRELPVLMRGLHASIHLMTLSNQMGLELMKKRLIRSQGPIRYAILSDGPSLSTLAHPLLLRRLAMFLYDCTRQAQEKRAQGGVKAVVLKPMVVACLAPGRGVYVVVGVQSTMEGGVGEVERSRMSSAFRSSAMGVGILDEVRHDSFDGTSMEVPQSKMHRFIEYLHTVLTHI